MKGEISMLTSRLVQILSSALSLEMRTEYRDRLTVLHGSTILILSLTFLASTAAHAQAPTGPTFVTLHSFSGPDGEGPFAGLVQAAGGDLYGATSGTIFEITPSGTLTTLYSFCSQPGCADGTLPYAGLIRASDGNFYGTTYEGGANHRGTAFKITASGVLTTLYSFCSQSGCPDGAGPHAELVQATSGNVFGTTTFGGSGPRDGGGTIFEITPDGAMTTLYRFCAQSGCRDGGRPVAGLIQAGNRNLYGTTKLGGANGAGTIFTITPGGMLTTLYSFCPHSYPCTDGAEPFAGLVQASDGDFYGATYKGGTNAAGTIFRITPGGTLTTLYSFCARSGCTDGGYLYAGLIQASDGNLYGTTVEGGTYGLGTIFKITPGGALTTLYSFGSQSDDGIEPYAGLVQARNGDFYGTTLQGGASGSGTVFSLSVGLAPLMQARPTSR
jgi:uncharacterized repeat protein (TIGR03803 family)